ncbi:MAG TPA: hypothetical protein VIH22_14440 [Cyclobacteriaceae bacterium]|jgi:hypothetical protein
MFNFLQISTNTHLRRNKSLRTCLPYSQASRVGVIFTVEDKQKHNHVKEFVKRLEKDGKKVTVICFLPDDKQNYEFLFDFFTAKDFTVWGNVSSTSAIKFTNIDFDYLFYLDTDPNVLILNLLARCKAKCRLGKFWETGKPFFELMIESNGDTKELMDNIYKYTILLR